MKILERLELLILNLWDIAVRAFKRDRLPVKPGPVRAADPLIIIPIPRYRTYIAFGLIVVLFAVLALRVFYLQFFSTDFLQTQGEQRFARTISIEGTRGEILDRNGVVLASSQPCRSIWADPEFMESVEPARLKALARALGMS